MDSSSLQTTRAGNRSEIVDDFLLTIKSYTKKSNEEKIKMK